MAISDHLSAAHVLLDANVRNKRHLFEVMAVEMAPSLGCAEREIVDALQSREELGSTALGKGVAIPHAEVPGAARPVVFFARLRNPIEFESRDAAPVDLVFSVLWPSPGAKGLLNAMSEICGALRHQELLRHMRIAQTPAEIIQLLRDHPWGGTTSPATPNGRER